jgi:hypothetical protein
MATEIEPGDIPRPSVRLLVAGLVALLAVVWFFRPWFQGIIYGFYTTPMALVVVVIGLALAGWLLTDLRGRAPYIGPLTTVLVILLVASTAAAGVIAGETLGKDTMSGATETDALSQSDPERPRVVTKAVADRFASNTLNFPQYRVTGSDITVYNDSLYWSYALAPDGTFNYFTKQQHGTVLVDMTRQNAQVDTFEGDIDRGIGTAFYNHHRWKALKKGPYLVDYKDPFMVVHEGEQYVAAPYTKPKFHATPLPHTTPEWGGVVLFDGDGNFKDLSPAEAQANPVLQDQRLYPFDLARDRVAATKYRNGIVNTFTSHREEVELAPVPGENNDQPFMVLSEEGPEYLVAVEPYGDAQGLKEVWTVDARSGEFERYAPPESLFGPRKAADFVRQAARTTDWDRFNPSEPIPVVVDGELFWEIRVVPEDNSGIAYIAFVNAGTSDVQEAETNAEIRAFMRGDDVTSTDEPGETTREPGVIVKRVGPDGNVIEEIRIYANETLVVEPANETGS